MPACTIADVVISPFNDLEATESLIKQNRQRLAAIIVEPIMGAAGLIDPMPEYLKALRDLADRYEVVLIFDEVITFRLSRGGMQEIEEVIPDMTTLGKIIGGGFPVGAFGGRQEIMSVFDPERPKSVNHGGTFNANNVTMGAGLAALEIYDQAAVERVNALGDRLREGFRWAAGEVGIKVQLTGRGSLLNVHWGERPPRNARESMLMGRQAGELVHLLHLQMLNQGIHSARRGMYVVSTAMGEAETDQAVQAFASALKLFRPYVEQDLAYLLDKQ